MPPADQDEVEYVPARLRNLIYAIKYQHPFEDFTSSFEALCMDGQNFYHYLGKWRDSHMNLNMYQLALLYLRKDIAEYLHQKCIKKIPSLIVDLPNKYKFYQNFHF